MSREYAVEARGLQKAYGQRIVLDVHRCVFEAGHRYALIGPNGSGKSTLLRIMAGTEGATAGMIGVTGEATREDLTVGYMPQSSYVFGFSVRRNVELALDAHAMSADEKARRVDEALEAVGMLQFADAKGSSLSGGEAQRVALARIFARDLDVVLLDEPTASMDVAATMLAEEVLERYCDRTGCLLIMATHAPGQARRVADQVVMLADGCVVEAGEVERVLAQPQSQQGRAFLSYWKV